MRDEVLNYINTHVSTTFACSNLTNAVKYEFDATHITYNEGPIGTKRLRGAMASHLNDHFNPFIPVTSEHVTFTTGVTALNEMIALTLTDEGEGILLGRPIYGSFYGDLMTKSKYIPSHTSTRTSD
jgi:xeroderma pigmentosum group C-complementing protein